MNRATVDLAIASATGRPLALLAPDLRLVEDLGVGAHELGRLSASLGFAPEVFDYELEDWHTVADIYRTMGVA